MTPMPDGYCPCCLQDRVGTLVQMEKAAQIAHEWPLQVDNCVRALHIGASAKDWAVAFVFVADQIAAEIRAALASEGEGKHDKK